MRLQEKQKQQVRKAMASLLYEHKTAYPIGAVKELFNLTYPNGQPMLGVLAEKQKLPDCITVRYIDLEHGGWKYDKKLLGNNCPMLKAGWKRCLD